MVYHDQNRIIAVGGGEVGDEIHRDLLEGACAFRQDGGKWGMRKVGVHLVGLACSAAGNELVNEGGQSWPPVVLLEKGDSVEITAMSPH